MNIKFTQNYVLAKARAIWGRSLTPQNYSELLACRTVSDAADYLRTKTDYADAFESVNTSSLHRAQLESILHRRLFNEYMSLCKYQMSVGCDFYNFFILKNDTEQLLRIISHLKSGSMENYIYSLPAFYEEHSNLNLFTLSKVRTEAELVAATERTVYADTVKRIFSKKHRFNYVIPAEIEFDLFMADRLCEYVRDNGGNPKKSELIRLFTVESDMYFLNSVYRLLRFPDVPKEYVATLANRRYSALTPSLLTELALCPGTDEFLKILSGTVYKKIAEYAGSMPFDTAAKKYEYSQFSKKLRFSTDPDTVMYSFMYLAKSEIYNIVHIVEGIRYSVSADRILPLLNGTD